MASTLTIPLVTLQPGTLSFGPSNAADSETKLVLTIDRTVTGGLNSLTSATTIDISVWQSNDAGATWSEVGGVGMVGGVYQNRHGVTYTTSTMTTNLQPGTSRQLKATVTVAGTAAAVAGTLVSS